MAKRKSISKKTRFEVFKRDKFTCQYCGDKAPEVVLHIDHIHPVAEGGTNEILNLITACEPCNLGKGKRKLSDSAVIEKQVDQLTHLQERREQLEMLLAWRKELDAINELEVDAVVERIDLHMPGYSTNENGRAAVRGWLKTFPLTEVLECVDIGASQYLITTGTDSEIQAGFDRFWQMTPRIMGARKRDGEDPSAKEAYYVRGIIRNRFEWINEIRALELIRDGQHVGLTFEHLKEWAAEAKNWSTWKSRMVEVINDLNTGE